MEDFSELLPSRNIIDIIGVEAPDGYNKKYFNHNSITSSPLNVLAIKVLSEQGYKFNDYIKLLRDAYSKNFYTDFNEKIIDTWFNLYRLEKPASDFKHLVENNKDIMVSYYFADLANYMFLTNRNDLEHILMAEWLHYLPELHIHKTHASYNRLADTSAFSRVINIMSSNYSISEIMNIMFMNYESNYKFFTDNITDDKITPIMVNNTAYQMLMIYYYQVAKEIRHEDPNNSLRLKEFMNHDLRQEFYRFVASLCYENNKSLYIYEDGMSDGEYYLKLEDIVDIVHIFIISNIPVTEWFQFEGLPKDWVATIVKEQS